MHKKWWFFWVITGYVYISLITKEVNTLTATSLTLIGISAGTGLAAVSVDKQKTSDQENQKLSLQGEKKVVTARIALLEAAKPAPGTPETLELHDRRKRLEEIEELLKKFPDVRVVPVSKGLIDVLRDGDGVSFHRFQIAVWTVVLGLVFIKSVFLDLVMPDFDTTLLGLMGISSGTYIGFKFPEK